MRNTLPVLAVSSGYAQIKIAPLDPGLERYVSVSPGVEEYTVTITNISQEPLRGFSVEFIGHSNYVHMNRDVLNPHMFAPGASSTEYASHALQLLNSGHPLPGGYSRADVLRGLANQPPVVRVNFVIDQSGRMIGPDPNNNFARLEAERTARQQLAATLKVAADPKATLDQLRSLVPAGGPSAQGLYEGDFATRQTRIDARNLWARIDADERLGKSNPLVGVENYIARAEGEIALHK